VDACITNDSCSTARQVIVLWKVGGVIGVNKSGRLAKAIRVPHITIVTFDIDLMTHFVLQQDTSSFRSTKGT
jgi:hypothetical protein